MSKESEDKVWNSKYGWLTEDEYKWKKEAEQVKRVAQVIASMCAFFGVFLLFLTSLFIGELAGFVSFPHTRETPFVNMLSGTLTFVAMTVFCFVLAYGMWRLKKWAIYVTAALTCLFFVFVLYLVVTDPGATPFAGFASMMSGLLLAYLYRFREHFK